MPAAARDHGGLCPVPVQDSARLARTGAAAGRQRAFHVQAEPVGGGVGHAALLAGVAEFAAEERRIGFHRTHQRRTV